MKFRHYQETDRMGDYTNEVEIILEEGDFQCECGTITRHPIECILGCGENYCSDCYDAAERDYGVEYGVCYWCADLTKLKENENEPEKRDSKIPAQRPHLNPS